MEDRGVKKNIHKDLHIGTKIVVMGGKEVEVNVYKEVDLEYHRKKRTLELKTLNTRFNGGK